MAEDKIISLDECCEVLQKDLQTKHFEIVEYNVKSLAKEVHGIMAGHYSLQVVVKINNNKLVKKYFVKRMLSKYDIQNQMIKLQGAYEKEKFIYDFLAELTNLEPKYSNAFIPKCFLAVKEEKFVLEDLRPEGYDVKSYAMQLDLQHLKMALKVLAQFHAASIIYENRKSQQLNTKYKMTQEYSQFFKDSLYRQNEENYLGNNIHKTSLNVILALLPKIKIYSEEEKQELLQKVSKKADCVFELVKESNKYQNVINHGDIWINNLLFKHENDDIIDCKLIDFQAIRYTVPAHDFLFLLHSSNITEFINQNQEELQQFYYDSLMQILEKFNIDLNSYISYDEFLQSMEYVLPFIILQKAGFSTMYALLVDPSIEKDPEKFKKFMYEDRTDICLDVYETNEMFREIVHDSFHNLKFL